MANTIDAGEVGPFRVEVQWWPTDYTNWDFEERYGKFCELPDGRRDHTQARNDPKGGDFYLRTPGAWSLRDIDNGTYSWVRTDRTAYGWFKLAEHPRHEAEWLIANEGLAEREAWQKVLARWEEIVRKLAKSDLSMIDVIVEVCWGDRRVGHARIHSVETESYVTNEKVLTLVRECGFIDEALSEAQAYFEERSEKTEQTGQ